LSTSVLPPLGDSDRSWSELERCLAEIAELSRSDVSFGEFAKETLVRTVRVLAARGGAFWVRGLHEELHLQCHVGCEQWELTSRSPASAAHHHFLQAVLRSGKASIVSPRPERPDLPFDESAYDCCWIAAPFEIDGVVVGIVEVARSAGDNESTAKGNLRLLEMVCELTADFFRRQQVRELRHSEHRWQQYESLVLRVHADLDLRSTAFELVNDGRAFVGCDRVSLLVPRGDDLRVIAISGVDTFDDRSHLVNALETLAQAVVRSGQALRYRGETAELAPQLEEPIGDYVDLSHALTMDVIPLRAADDRESVGAMVFEQFAVSDAPPEHERGMDERAMAERVVRVASLGGSAVRNALDYNTLPLLNASRWARRWASGLGSFRRRRLIVVTGSILSIVLALMLIPATVYVKAEGELQPSIRRDIYAPLDGEVVDVPAVHDGDVVKDEILVLLRSRPLEIKLQGLQGEYQTTEKKLLAVASARVQSDSEDTGSANRPRQLAAEEQELKQSLLSQRKQMELVRQQRESLCVRSPINGRVLTWNPRELLEDRPVQRGQLLVSLADIDGPWGVELWVPDHQIGYILAAQRNHPLPLTVTFSLATDRRTSHQGRLQTVGARSESIDGQPASVRVTATVPKTAIDHLRPGARLYAKVDCGTRSLGYVWLHEIVDTLQAWLLF